jgi:hypothetical protein
MNLVWNESWNVVLLDISLPGRNGLDLLKEIKTARSKLPVLIVSGHPEEQFATRALKSGASGYVSKNGPPETLTQAIRQAMSGRMFITQQTAELLASQLTVDSEHPPEKATGKRMTYRPPTAVRDWLQCGVSGPLNVEGSTRFASPASRYWPVKGAKLFVSVSSKQGSTEASYPERHRGAKTFLSPGSPTGAGSFRRA